MKVNFDIRNGRIGIEGDAPDLFKVLQAAKDLMPHVSQIQITADSDDSIASSAEAEHAKSRAIESSPSRQTMRQFARSLSLDNASERIAAVTYYANKIEGRSSCSPKEIEGWFTMCGFQKPSQMSVALYDAKRKYGYVDNVSRGNWKISNQGENVIISKIEQRGNKE